jgi:hypothetical protein
MLFRGEKNEAFIYLFVICDRDRSACCSSQNRQTDDLTVSDLSVRPNTAGQLPRQIARAHDLCCALFLRRPRPVCRAPTTTVIVQPTQRIKCQAAPCCPLRARPLRALRNASSIRASRAIPKDPGPGLGARGQAMTCPAALRCTDRGFRSARWRCSALFQVFRFSHPTGSAPVSASPASRGRRSDQGGVCARGRHGGWARRRTPRKASRPPWPWFSSGCENATPPLGPWPPCPPPSPHHTRSKQHPSSASSLLEKTRPNEPLIIISRHPPPLPSFPFPFSPPPDPLSHRQNPVLPPRKRCFHSFLMTVDPTPNQAC